jgi:hypothetical protein
MVPQVAAAAGNEAEQTLDTAQRNRFIDRVPGARSGAGAYSHPGVGQQTGGGRIHNRAGSGSSSSSVQQRGGVGLAPSYASHLQARGGLGNRMQTGRKSTLPYTFSSSSIGPDYSIESAPNGTPRQSQIPVLGGTRQGPVPGANLGHMYQASPVMQQSVGGNSLPKNFGGLGFGGTKSSRRIRGPLQR